MSFTTKSSSTFDGEHRHHEPAGGSERPISSPIFIGLESALGSEEDGEIEEKKEMSARRSSRMSSRRSQQSNSSTQGFASPEGIAKARSYPLRSLSARWKAMMMLRTASEKGEKGSSSSSEELPQEPPSISVISSFRGSVNSAVSHISEALHRLPVWQYRLLVGSVIVLLCSLILLIVVSVIYGFGLTYPHIQVISIQPTLASYLDAEGGCPVKSILMFDNPNTFPIHAAQSTVHVFADKAMTEPLGDAINPAVTLKSHEEDHEISFSFTIKNIMNIKGGPEIVNAVLGGQPSFFYTQSVIKLTVKSLGFMPIQRHFKAECAILKLWGTNITMSDCHGHFTK